MKLSSKIFTALILVFLFAPIVILLVFSFNASKSLSVMSGGSLYWYRELFRDAETLGAVRNTLVLAVSAALISTVMGTAAAVGIHRLRSKAVRLGYEQVTNIPMINPDIITGVSLFLLFVFLHFSQGYLTVILAHITFCTPYVVLSVMPKLQQMNPNIYEAALDLGATPQVALRKVLIPQLKPGMVSGFILAFTMSLDDFAVTFFTRGTIGLDTLSTYIYTDARKGGLTPELRPLMTLIFLVVLILLIIINIRQDRLSKLKENK
jgi:spermidine/putrescine transport system permease protein